MTTSLAKLNAHAVAFYVAHHAIERMRDLQQAVGYIEFDYREIDPASTNTYADVMGLVAYARGEKDIAIPVHEAVAQILCGLAPPPSAKDPGTVLAEWSVIVDAALERELAEGAAPATPEPVRAPVEPRFMSREQWEKEGEDE